MLTEGNAGFNLGNVFVAFFLCRIHLWRDDWRRFYQNAELLAVKFPACHAKIEAKVPARVSTQYTTPRLQTPFGAHIIIG